MRGSHTADGKIERLRSCAFLRAASPLDLLRVSRAADAVRVPPGVDLLTRGLPTRWVYLVVSGELSGADPDEFVGDLPAFAGCESPVTVTTLTEVEAFAFRRSDYVSLIDEAPPVRSALRSAIRRVLWSGDAACKGVPCAHGQLRSTSGSPAQPWADC